MSEYKITFPPYGNSVYILKNLLRAHEIPEDEYSFGCYADDRVCLEAQKGLWTVYIGSLGQRRELTQHKSLHEACIQFIERIADSREEQERMLREFNSASLKTTRAASSSRSAWHSSAGVNMMRTYSHPRSLQGRHTRKRVASSAKKRKNAAAKTPAK